MRNRLVHLARKVTERGDAMCGEALTGHPYHKPLIALLNLRALIWSSWAPYSFLGLPTHRTQ